MKNKIKNNINKKILPPVIKFSRLLMYSMLIKFRYIHIIILEKFRKKKNIKIEEKRMNNKEK